MKRFLSLTGVATALFFTSCAFDPNTLGTDPELQAIIDNSTALAEDDMQESSATTVAGAPSPVNTGWARTSWSISSFTNVVLSSEAGSGAAVLRIDRTITGNLRIASNWNTFLSSGILANKPFTMSKSRQASFEKKAGKWKLTGLSFATAASPSSTVGLGSVSIYGSSNAATALVTVTGTTMTNLYHVDNLPSIASSQWVKVTATVTATSGVTPLVYLHHGNTRRIMHDDGVSGGDSVSGDLIYTGYTYVGTATMKHFHVDVLDAATLNNTSVTNNYSSTVWHFVLKAQ